MKAWNCRALEGMPLKLLIMSLLISLTAPVVMGSVESYERSTAHSVLMRESERLVAVIEEVMSAGEGNRRIIDISMPVSADRYHLALEIGGPADEGASRTIRCTCDGVPFATKAPENPPSKFAGIDGRTLRLEGGEHHIAVECIRAGGRTVAVLEAVR